MLDSRGLLSFPTAGSLIFRVHIRHRPAHTGADISASTLILNIDFLHQRAGWQTREEVHKQDANPHAQIHVHQDA